MRYFLDTNIFIRFLVSEKENKRLFEECHKFLINVRNGQIKTITTSFVFAELVWVCSKFYNFPKIKIAQALKALSSIGIRFVDDYCNINQAIYLFENYNVKFTDCLIASCINDKKDVILISYDKDFDKLGVKRKEPGKVV